MPAQTVRVAGRSGDQSAIAGAKGISERETRGRSKAVQGAVLPGRAAAEVPEGRTEPAQRAEAGLQRHLQDLGVARDEHPRCVRDAVLEDEAGRRDGEGPIASPPNRRDPEAERQRHQGEHGRFFVC